MVHNDPRNVLSGQDMSQGKEKKKNQHRTKQNRQVGRSLTLIGFYVHLPKLMQYWECRAGCQLHKLPGMTLLLKGRCIDKSTKECLAQHGPLGSADS